MSRTKLLQDLRLMKFEDILSKRTAGKLTQEQGAEILGVSVRTLRRWEDRFEAEGAEGLYDRRLGKLPEFWISGHKISTDLGPKYL